MSAESPRFSVVFSAHEDRGVLQAALRSWWQQQEVDPGAFEVLFGLPAPDPALEAWFASHARPQDRLRVFAGASQNAVLEGLVAEATGTWLLLTECHVMASPGTLAAVAAALDQDPGRYSMTIGARSHGAGRLAETMEWYFHGHRDDVVTRHGWHNVVQRGTVLPREAYLAAGGLGDGYHHFAFTLLSMKLAEIGLGTRRLPDRLLAHVDERTLLELQETLVDYGTGERLARQREGAIVRKYLPRRRDDAARTPAALLAVMRVALERLPLGEAAYRRGFRWFWSFSGR